MTPEEEKQYVIEHLRDRYGIDVPSMVEAAFDLGRSQGQLEECFDTDQSQNFKRSKREKWLWRKVISMTADTARLKRAISHMMGLMLEESSFLSKSGLRQCLEAAQAVGDRALVKRLGRLKDLLELGGPRERGRRRKRKAEEILK